MTRETYDFVEVGTSCFNTLIQNASDTTKGLSVEPIRRYLDMLPDKPHVQKVNVALVAEVDYPSSGYWDLYYVEPAIIEQFNLGQFMYGCNSVGKPHDFHLNWCSNPNLWHMSKDRSNIKTVNLMEQGLVTVEQVKCLTFAMLAEEYNIGQIEYLQTDTEGHDAKLLMSIINYYQSHDMMKFLPKKIMFENNTHNAETELLAAKTLLRDVGYTVEDISIYDSIATLTV